MSLVFGGWMSNLIDRLHQAYVLDYIRWDFLNHIVYFNLADAFQTCGWIFFIQQVIHLRADILKRNERRKRWFVLNKFQYQFLGFFTLVFVLMTVFFLLLIKQVLFLFGVLDNSLIKEISSTFFIGTLFALGFLYFSIGLFFAYFSNKVYGPIYAFEKYMKELIAGKSDSRDFRLRQGDHFKSLEVLARDIKKHIKEAQSSKNKD